MDDAIPGAGRLAPYATRTVRPLGTETIADHSIKFHALEAGGLTVTDGMLEAARPVVAEALYTRAERSHEHRLGFAILHAGKDALWLLVDRWIDGNALCQRLFSAPSAGPFDFEDRSGGDLCFCVWEGAVVDHERRAFRDTMMRAAPDRGAYLNATLSGPV